MMRIRPFLLALAAAALFGAATPFSKSLLADLSPFQLSGLLYLGAAAGVLPIALRGRGLLRPWAMDTRTRRLLLGAVIFGGIVGPVLMLFGLRMAAAASVALWLNLEAVATALLGVWVFRDHLGRNGWIGAAGILLASVLLSWGQGAAGWQAGLLVAGACVCWGLDNHMTALIDGITPAQSTFWKGLVAGLVNLTVGLLVEPFGAGIAQIGGALLVGLFSYGFSIVFYITAAQQLGATRSQLIFSSAPYFAIALSVLWLGETISAVQIVAALIVGVSIVLLTIEWHSHDHDHVALEHEHWHAHGDGHHNHAHDGAAGQAAAGSHSHRHRHRPLHHAHHHWPDLHHRHEHG
ncbi:MAG: DMT family transporter [Caldilineaceae bacterium]|nr:DMT family transporter [Caldilineaceae bacterium]MCB9119863.1 DMT family transporter [Caldilineaceae bacterium]MCB9124440.1 DMT family transporter [Caldilineaceae bacterium]